jgi:Fe2+ or Zn2+ uptake regulation protein
MMDIVVWEHARLALLRALADLPKRAGNESILADLLDSIGLPLSRDQVRTALTWLSEQGLVALKTPGGYHVAELTPRGAEVAEGRAPHPGVKRPLPGVRRG